MHSVNKNKASWGFDVRCASARALANQAYILKLRGICGKNREILVRAAVPDIGIDADYFVFSVHCKVSRSHAPETTYFNDWPINGLGGVKASKQVLRL